MKKKLSRLTDWGHWPFAVFHFPLFFLWVWYCFRSRAVWFFSAANPTISFGGFEGESKSEIYRQMPAQYYPATWVVQPHSCEHELLQKVKEMFSFPFVVKPDVGMQGILFRKIESSEQLLQYHRRMPAPYLVQAYVAYPLEVSVFYCRLPGQSRGFITAFILKTLPTVTGNGTDTVRQLLLQKKESAAWLPAVQARLGRQLDEVLPQGQTIILSYIGNRMNGAVFTSLQQHIDEELVTLFDTISGPGRFCYGRYDIKCKSIESLKKGTDFSILEFNGAGSIPNHIYTPGITLLQAWKEVARHWQWLFRISFHQHKTGIPYWGFGKGLRFLQQSKKHFSELKRVDRQLLPLSSEKNA